MPVRLEPPPPQFTIIDETADYLVVDKPAFLLTHPSKPTTQPTLLGELRKLLAFEIVNAGQVSIINRLDRETSGLVLVAKTSAVARKFGLLMQEERITKEYLAIICGWPSWETQLVDAPLDRQGKHRKSAVWLKQAIHQDGAPAQTEFQVERRFLRSEGLDGPSPDPLSRRERRTRSASEGKRVGKAEAEGASPVEDSPWRARTDAAGEGTRRERNISPIFAGDKFSLIRAIPKTGRTHQIRVHLSSLGHPVLGDKIYGPNEGLYLQFIETGWTSDLARQLLLPRHALHSTKMAVEGVGSWTSPLPQDLAGFCSGGLRPTDKMPSKFGAHSAPLQTK